MVLVLIKLSIKNCPYKHISDKTNNKKIYHKSKKKKKGASGVIYHKIKPNDIILLLKNQLPTKYT